MTSDLVKRLRKIHDDWAIETMRPATPRFIKDSIAALEAAEARIAELEQRIAAGQDYPASAGSDVTKPENRPDCPAPSATPHTEGCSVYDRGVCDCKPLRGSVTNALPPEPPEMDKFREFESTGDPQDLILYIDKLRTAAEALQRDAQAAFDLSVECRARAVKAERENEQLRADAERYGKVRLNPAMLLHLKNSEFDAAIDAARKGGE